MKRFFTLAICTLAFAGCAHKHAKPESQAGASQAGVPAPSAEEQQAQKMMQLHAEGVELLYSKDPRVKDPKKAFEKLSQAAEMGNPASMDLVGGFYATGMGGVVEKSCSRAINWYEKASEGGYPLAFNNLAYMLVTCEDKQLRDPERAESIMKFLFQHQPNIVALLDTYATVLAEQREFKQAAKTMEAVIDIQKFMDDNPERIDQAEQALKLFKQGKKLSITFDGNPANAKKKTN